MFDGYVIVNDDEPGNLPNNDPLENDIIFEFPTDQVTLLLDDDTVPPVCEFNTSEPNDIV